MNNLDMTAFEAWLTGKMSGSDLSVQRIGGGQSNPTWFVDWGEARMVLRNLHAYANVEPFLAALEKEIVVMGAASMGVLGTPFYLMDRLEGRVLTDCSLPGLTPRERREIYLDMARTLARLHAVRPDAVGLSDFGKPGNYFERQIARWGRQYRESPGGRVEALDRLLDWLTAHMPQDDGAVAIAHGDFRLGNMLFHPTEPRVIGVLDWELSTLGHPLADLGFCVMPWHTAPDEYGGLLGSGWESSGIPTRAEFEAEYHAHARPTAPLTAFHMAFALFRFAVIFVGIADRARSGNAASEEAATLAPLAERFAIRALEVVETAPDLRHVEISDA